MLEAPIIVGIVFFSIVTIVKIASDASTRRKLIEKGQMNADSANLFFDNPELSSLASLKWGLVLVGIGLASFLVKLLDTPMLDDEGALGLILIFAGIGFLAYYPIAQRKIKEIRAKSQMTQQ